MTRFSSRWQAKAWAVLAALVAVGAVWLLKQPNLSSGFRLLLALTPVIPMVFYFKFMTDCFRGCDELIRKIQLEGIFIAFIGTALLTMTLGLLIEGRILPDLSMGRVWPYIWMGMFLLWGLGAWTAGRRYR